LPEKRFDTRPLSFRKSPHGIESAAIEHFLERLPDKEQRWSGPQPRQRWEFS
jgi:hypothetical protein